MAIRLEHNQKQIQKQVLSPKMIESVEVLQMSAQELSEYARALSMENPVMDLEETAPGDRNQEQLKKLEWLAGLDHQKAVCFRKDREAAETDGVENIRDRETDSFAESLRLQFIGGMYTQQEISVFSYITECLDSRGYFTVPVKELAEHFGISEAEAGRCLEIMRDLEPAGVCAGSLRQCLKKQLEKRKTPCKIEIEIVDKYLDLLGKNQLPAIAGEMKIPLERVKKAKEIIQSLHPKPAQGYSDGEPMRYIIPDLIIVKFEAYFEIVLNDYSCPVFHLNQDYLKLLRSECTPDVKEYLVRKVRQAEQFKEYISRRNTTLKELAKCILEAQEEFFLNGRRPLKSFRMQEAAEKMGVHKSTVSRAVRDKYLQCCWGTYPLGFFFSRGLKGREGEEPVAADAIRQKITGLIEAEDKKKPYSDQKLAELLSLQGVEISRRTAAKYRESMGIANGRERKEF